MAVDGSIGRETETPSASDSQPAMTKMGQKMALLLSLIDNDSSRHVDDDDDSKPMREAETPPGSDSKPAKTKMALVLSLPDNACSRHVDGFKPLREAETPPASDSQPANTKMGQKMALLLSLPDNGSTRCVDGFKPMNEERAIVLAQQSMDVDDYVPPPPLRIVRPESLQNGQEKCPGFHYEGATKARTKNTSTGITYTRRRGRPESAKSKIEQKPALFDSSCGSSNYSKGNKDDDFEPPTPTRKRRRPSRSKSSKRKMEQEPLLVDSSSSSEGKKDKDHDFEPDVSNHDGRRKYTCVKGSASDRAEEVENKLPAEGPSFVKIMLRSHVVKVFWLALPAGFCRKNLPKHDVDIVLEDEEGKTCKTKYLADKTALSGGWKGFAKQHDLMVGNALVFQLVQPTKFKAMYILRENKFTTTDGALGLLSLYSSMDNKTTSKKEQKESSDKDTKSKKVPRKKKKKVPEVITKVFSKPSSNDSANLASEEAAGSGIRYRDPDIGDFVSVKSTPSSTMEEADWYKKLKLERAGVAKQVRDFELRLSNLKDRVRKMDVEMEEMEKASLKKKEQAVRELATAPW